MIKRIIGFLFILVFLGIALFYGWWKLMSQPVNPGNQESQIFVIPQGQGVSEIAISLQKAGLIKNPRAFQLMAFRLGIQDQLQAGDYRLAASMTLREICLALTHGTLDVWVTIPEGVRREEIGWLINEAFLKQRVEFSVPEFIEQTSELEGYLFPDTYLIPKTSTVEEVVKMLTNNFATKFDSLILNTSLTKQQVVIIASLLEREVKADQDRNLVAGIILKRLKKGWPLQVDAALQYAKANTEGGIPKADYQWWPKLDAQDLKIESDYNTYDNLGLPPTAICNPGIASLKAVLEPEDSDYWFYLSDKSGKLHYAKTNEEQEANIKNYLNFGKEG